MKKKQTKKIKGQSKNKKRKHKKKKFSYKLLGVIVLITAMFYYSVFFLLFTIGKMEGRSMEPTIGSNQKVLINRHASFKRFDLVYVKSPNKSGEYSIKRVIGLPGDSLSYHEDELTINGEQKVEPYLDSQKKQLKNVVLTNNLELLDVTGESIVPKDSYFLMGDNRGNSVDSRNYGTVKKELIVGKVSLELFPLK